MLSLPRIGGARTGAKPTAKCVAAVTDDGSSQTLEPSSVAVAPHLGVGPASVGATPVPGEGQVGATGRTLPRCGSSDVGAGEVDRQTDRAVGQDMCLVLLEDGMKTNTNFNIVFIYTITIKFPQHCL